MKLIKPSHTMEERTIKLLDAESSGFCTSTSEFAEFLSGFEKKNLKVPEYGLPARHRVWHQSRPGLSSTKPNTNIGKYKDCSD
ncbi:hypothetical protein FKM82_006595 [Ascaphus truei]